LTPLQDAGPIAIEDVLDARRRIRPYLPPTPLRSYPLLDAALGYDISVLVKHENHTPTGTFKVRSALALLTSLSDDEKRRGVVAASRGNHGLALAWAGAAFGVPVTVCVPWGNSSERNDSIRGFGARLIEQGKDYEDAVDAAYRLVRDEGLRLVHASNDRQVLAGAATLSLEILEEASDLDAMVIGVGGGSQAVGAITVAAALRPSLSVFAVQAAKAAAVHDSWHAKRVIVGTSADTLADAMATRRPAELTFPALLAGLAGFVTVSEAEIAVALRLILPTTHNLAEGSGAIGVAGLLKLRQALPGRRVAVVLSGGNIDRATLTRVLNGEI
jgi:threonine dehydratase